MIEATRPAPPAFDRIQRGALIVGIVGIALLIVGAVLSPAQFFRSYLVGYLFWLGIALGCLAIVMLHYLSGGTWGAVLRRFLESGTKTIPLMALLFVPLVFGLPYLYVWARPEAVAKDELLQYQSLYLNIPFFLIRAAIYFVTWGVLVYFLNKWSAEQDRTADPEVTRHLRLLSAGGEVLFGLTATFAFIDWVMSLEPHWFSTIYSAMVTMGDVLGAFAFVIAVVALLANWEAFAEVTTPRLWNDFGSLLLAFVMIWAYLAFSQFMLIWAGNLTDEIPWYLRRINFGWQWVALLVVLFHFALPFALLLSRDLKRNAQQLAMVAIVIVVMHLIDTFWLVEPAFTETGLRVHWLDVVAPVGLGGIWIAVFVWQLKKRPLLPLHDTQLQSREGRGHE
ncbi:MAG: hypothetical protein M5U01_19950 [Ardenticatenaceae bacterium]|nr:hypothetical protein [Ardenticatenaceae bacterium]